MSVEWMREARCSKLNRGDYFFTDATSKHRQRNYQMGRQRVVPDKLRRAERVAVACCTVCPVMRECLEYALRNDTFRLVTRGTAPDPRYEDSGSEVASVYALQGVWGGMTASERRGLSVDDLEEALAWARARAVREGLAPPDIEAA
jgi:hypothetical protein